MGGNSGRRADRWQEAKRRCRLSEEEIRMAKEMGLNPRSLIKNIPAKSEPWKAPVSEWIRDLYAKRFGGSRGQGTARSAGWPPSPSAEPTSRRTPRLIRQPKGRITVDTIANVIRSVEGMDKAAKVRLCDELAVSQPEALGWVLALQRQGVSMPVVDHVLHVLLVIFQSISDTVGGPVPRVSADVLEKAAAKVDAMSQLLQGETEEEAGWLTYLMAESHPERNLLAYVADQMKMRPKDDRRPEDDRAIYATAVLLEALLQTSGLARATDDQD